MTTYYVRASGSNSAAGTSAGAAWATLGKALNSGTPVTAGDTVYVGAGSFRESATITNTVSGSDGSLVNIIGDIDGAQTGDAGEAIITCYQDDQTTPPAFNNLALGTTSYLSFSYLTFVNNTNNNVTNSTGHDYTFTDCTFLSWGGSGLNVTTASSTNVLNLTVDRCAFFSPNGLGLTILTSGFGVGTDTDHNILLQNCLFVAGTGVLIAAAATGRSGGIRIWNCTIFSGAAVAHFGAAAFVSSQHPVEIHGCFIWGSTSGLSANVYTNSYSMVEDFNLITSAAPRSGVPVGQNSITTGSIAPLVEVGQAYKNYAVVRPFFGPSASAGPLTGWGGSNNFSSSATGTFNVGGVWNAFLRHSPSGTPAGRGDRARFPTEGPGMRGPRRMLPMVNLPGTATVLGATNTSGSDSPSRDWTGKQRPAGGRSNLKSVGYIEYHDSAIKDTVTYDVSPASAKIMGPGTLTLSVPVDSGVSHTFSIRCLYDTAYGGQRFPRMYIVSNGEIGVTTQFADVAGGAWGTWQTITLSAFTPTASGIVKIRLYSFDGSGNGQVNFDSFAVA